MENTIESLPALLFHNLMEIINGNNQKEEIVYIVQRGLERKITELFNDMTNEIKEQRDCSIKELKELDGFFDRCNRIKANLDYFVIIDRLTDLKQYLANLDYQLSVEDKQAFFALRREIDGNTTIRGASRGQIISHYKKFTEYTPIFKKKRVEILVKCVIVPIIIQENLYDKILKFLYNTDNFFEIVRDGTLFTYPNSDKVLKSINNLLRQYKVSITGDKTIDEDSFAEFLKSLFLQLEDSSQERALERKKKADDLNKNVKSKIHNRESRMRDIEKFISKNLDKILGEETCGIIVSEKESIYMRIANLIEEDFALYNEKFKLDWDECNQHKGFKALKFYRMYKILCDYEDNESLNELGKELIQKCWKETSIYISPESNIVAPIYLGKNCLVTSACWIEKNVIIGHNTKIISSRLKSTYKESEYEYNDNENDGENFSLISIKANTLIMPNTLIYDIAHIDGDCVISSMSVLRDDIKKNSIYENEMQLPLETEEFIDVFKRYMEQLREDERYV
ncbi:hypothetical protein D3Z55_20775 [Clostridiaceae bacterium]|nr:hypothetical protein [Clostridiaceae bacterium]